MSTKKEDKRRRAIERQDERAKRTPQEQLKRLDDMFGEGKGAAKERARLAVYMLAPKVSPAPEVLTKMREAGEQVPKPAHGMGAMPPADLTAKVERFSKNHVDGKIVQFAGLGAGIKGQAILAYVPNPKKASLPEEFEGMEVLVIKGSRPKPVGE